MANKPTKDDYRVICPEPAAYQRGAYKPQSIYESRNPDGTRVVRGILSPHKHSYRTEECPWSGHPVEAIYQEKKD